MFILILVFLKTLLITDPPITASTLCPKKCNMWHVTRDTWHMTGGSEGVLMILRKRMTNWINQLMNYKGVCRTALAEPGLLKIIITDILEQFNIPNYVPNNYVTTYMRTCLYGYLTNKLVISPLLYVHIEDYSTTLEVF